MGRHGATGDTTARADRGRRRRRVLFVIGLLTCSTLVAQSSHAAFSGTTTNTNNTFGVGTVTITDDRGGTAMFTVPTLAPGATGYACMGVEYTGSLTPSGIKLYTTNAMESNAGGSYTTWANNNTSEADNNLSMEVQVGQTDLTTDPGNDCTKETGSFTDIAGSAPGTTMQNMILTNTSYGNGLDSHWGTITANKWRVWKFTYTFNSAAPDSAQGDGLQVTFKWEAQS